MRFDEFKNEIPFDIIEDLKVFMRNDPMFYRKEYLPCMCSLQDKIKNKEKDYRSILGPMVEKACSLYNAKYDITKKDKLLSNDQYQECMASIMNDESKALHNGAY